MFPQGKIHSAYNSSIHFEKGIQNIVSKSKNEIQILFVANFTEYFSNSKPNLFMYSKIYSSTFLKNKNIEEEYNLFYNQILNNHNTKTS